jgi:hypothetical protein
MGECEVVQTKIRLEEVGEDEPKADISDEMM